jgi:hypothetical protein
MDVIICENHRSRCDVRLHCRIFNTIYNLPTGAHLNVMNGFGNYAICLRGNIPFYYSPCLALGISLLAINCTVVSDSTLTKGNWLYEARFAPGLQ